MECYAEEGCFNGNQNADDIKKDRKSKIPEKLLQVIMYQEIFLADQV